MSTDAGRAMRSHPAGEWQCVPASEVDGLCAEAAQRAIDELLTVERVAAALHAACESWWESMRTANPDLLITVHSFEKHFERAAVLIAELRR